MEAQPAQTNESWPTLLRSAGFDESTTEAYAALFAENDFDFELLDELDRDVLKDIGIASVGHQVKIMRAIKKHLKK